MCRGIEVDSTLSRAHISCHILHHSKLGRHRGWMCTVRGSNPVPNWNTFTYRLALEYEIAAPRPILL